MRSTWAVSLLTLPFLVGCFQTIPSADGMARDPAQTGDGGADDAGPNDAGPDHASSDAGPDEEPVKSAARWRENGPSGEQEEGPVAFDLACVDASGAPERCAFACALDGASEVPCAVRYEADWVGTNAFGEPLAHRFCVRVTPEDGSAGSTVCRAWVAQPYGRFFAWLEEGLDAARTEISFTPKCVQRQSDGTLSEPREDCVFRFSLDSQPYLDGGDPFVLTNIEPGAHVLRAEVLGPGDLWRVMHTTEHHWTVAADAQPAVPRGFELPPLKSEAELEALGVGRLIPLYGAYAAACSSGGGDPAEYEVQMRTYLSCGFADGPNGPNTPASAQRIDACADALSARPVQCFAPPGISRQSRSDGPFSVRPPTECQDLTLTKNEVFGPRRCLTALDCPGACEYPSAWSSSPVLGYCASDSGPESRENIYCRARGCDEGMFCAGTCQRVSGPLEACNPSRRGVDCPRGYTCSGGAAPRCVEATAQLGDSCAFDSDCLTGMCEQHVCVPWE